VGEEDQLFQRIAGKAPVPAAFFQPGIFADLTKPGIETAAALKLINM